MTKSNANLVIDVARVEEEGVEFKKTFGPVPVPNLRAYLGIFLISSSVLLYELALTRIFAVILWSHLAFMVVSTALFGFGLSGVFLALRSLGERSLKLANNCLLFSLSILGSYLIIAHVPFRMWNFAEEPINFLYLAIWYLALLVPFFFAGLFIAKLLSTYPLSSSRLYGVDLLGAACGSLLLIPTISRFAAEGTVVFAMLLAVIAGLCLVERQERRLHSLLILGAFLLLIILPFAPKVLPISFHQTKRDFKDDLEHDRILATRWSPLSRVDIAKHKAHRSILKNYRMRAIWIDGGTNESLMLKWSGDVDALHPLKFQSTAAAYDLKEGTNPNVLVIGSSGGREVLYALSHGVKHIDAVEMDPSIYYFANQPEFANYMGHLYQNEKVSFINDEGRAFLEREKPETYDVIQFVNNYTPVAMASGAINLSETFLLTKESFVEFWNHLTPNGILALHRGATLRVATTALAALRALDISHPERHIVIFSGESPYFEGFLLKKNPWTKAELDKLRTFLSPLLSFHKRIFLWNPLEPEDQNIYSQVLGASTRELKHRFYHRLGVNLTPATDDQPFIEHYSELGKKALPNILPPEFKFREKQKWNGLIPRGDLAYVTVLFESALLSLFFIGIPLLLRARSSFRAKGFWNFFAYFASLGFSFITVEICLMKKYILFLGHPAYSITTILVVILLGAGCGSIFSERFVNSNLKNTLVKTLLLVALALVAESLLSPFIFHSFLNLEFSRRILITFLLLFPVGFLMGIPFPLGLQLINNSDNPETEKKKLVAWAWGINGYTTVIGSALTVFIALLAGFKMALFAAVAVYLCALFAIRKLTA